jgi:Tol biopolymer transport system component/DNA-binding winged helix-turn-helix (wHTH) protein
MTEQMAIGWPELSLARETPFGLAGTQVRPAALEVETDGKITALEPRVMKVLVALHRSHGKPVSRDELIDQCWAGRIVTEGALNRCVAQLRKALAANPRIKLDTIPTVGYRLQASAEVHRVGPASEAANADEPVRVAAPKAGVSRNKLIFAGAAAGVVIAAVGALLLAMPRSVTWTATSFHPITSELGMETHPALSPTGDQIVYAQRAESTQARDLYLRSVGEGTPVRITSHPADDYGAAWSPRGDRIAFVRTPPVGACRIVVVPVPLGAEREVGRCMSAPSMRLSWLNEETLVISDRPTARDIWRIRALDIETGQARDLTKPPASTLGDGDPAASPDGRHVVFRRTLLHGADDLFLLDVRTGRERALTTDGWKASGYVWSADSRHVFYSSNRGGAFGLWTVDIKTGQPPQRVSLGFGQTSFSRMSADRKNRLAVELPRGRGNLAAIAPSGEVSAVTNTTGYDWDPVIAPDGAVAYVSERGGSSEIWVTTPDGQSVRLTSIMGSYVNTPAWSPDGRTIAFVAVKGRRSEIYTVDRDGSRLRAATDDGIDKLDPAYSPRGDRLTYVGRTAAGYRLLQVALTPGAKPQPLPGGAGWRVLRAGPDGRLYGQKVGDDLILPVNAADRVPEIRPANYDCWAVGADGIYVARAPRGEVPSLWFHPWSGAPRKLADLPGFDGSLTVDAKGRVLFSRVVGNEIDLGLVDLSSNS